MLLGGAVVLCAAPSVLPLSTLGLTFGTLAMLALALCSCEVLCQVAGHSRGKRRKASGAHGFKLDALVEACGPAIVVEVFDVTINSASFAFCVPGALSGLRLPLAYCSRSSSL